MPGLRTTGNTSLYWSYLFLSAAAVFGSLFFYRYSYNPMIEDSLGFYAFYGCLCLLILFISFFLRNVATPAFFILLSATIIVVLCKYFLTGFSNEHYHAVIFFTLLSLLFVRCIIAFSPAIFCWSLLFASIIELAFACKEAWQAWTFHNFNNTTLTGNFGNSGIFACYTIITFPLIRYHIYTSIRNKNLRKRLVWFLLTLTTIIIFLTQARSAMLPLLLELGILATPFLRSNFDRYIAKNTWRLIWLITAIICFSAILLYQAWYLKQPSAAGRLQIWMICLLHWKEYVLGGTGLGAFHLFYPNWQADFFQHTPTYYPGRLLAGETYLAFNEFLQLFVETGLAGLLVFCGLMIETLRSRNTARNELSVTLKRTIFYILFCSFSTYIMHVCFALLLFLVCTCWLLYLNRSAIQLFYHRVAERIHWRSTHWFTTALALGIVYIFASQWNAIYQWHQLIRNEDTPKEQANQKYSLLYPGLKHDSKFLANYGTEMLASSNCNAAVNLLQQSLVYTQSYLLNEKLAEAYVCGHRYQDAELKYRFLINLAPWKFGPRYALLKLYLAKADTASAKNIAREIIQIPVKVPSGEVDAIKRQSIKLLGNDIREHNSLF